MSFYHTYRSNSFESLVGQRHIVDVLLAQLTTDSLNHCYLFYWPRGTWKTSTARLLAKAINVPDFTEGNIENEITQMIDEWRTLDYVEIDAASHTWVDNIREEIIEKALYTPSVLRKKVYVIDEVHMLSKWAFNALLKIMEEPPEYLMFILATTEIHKVPDTIISRCQVFNFRNHTLSDICWHLASIADKEKITYEDEWLRMIAKLSQWWMRDAIKYLEQVSILWSVTPENVSKFLWVVPQSVLEDIIRFYKKSDATWLFSLFSSLENWGTNLLSLMKDLLIRCDEHFLDDPALYSELTKIFSRIYSWIKGAPVPLVIIKAEFRKWLIDSPSKYTSLGSSLEQKQNITLSKGWKEESSMIAENSINWKSVEKMKDNDSEKNWEVFTSDVHSLKENLLPLLEKKMVKSTIEKYWVFIWDDNDIITLVIIQQQFFSMIHKPDILENLTKNVSSLMWKDITLKVVCMTKEELLHMQMWS